MHVKENSLFTLFYYILNNYKTHKTVERKVDIKETIHMPRFPKPIREQEVGMLLLNWTRTMLLLYFWPLCSVSNGFEYGSGKPKILNSYRTGIDLAHDSGSGALYSSTTTMSFKSYHRIKAQTEHNHFSKIKRWFPTLEFVLFQRHRQEREVWTWRDINWTRLS